MKCMILLLLAGGWLANANQSTVALDIGRVQTASEIIGHATLQEAFASALRQTGISGGVVTLENGCAPIPRDFNLPKGIYLPDALDTLTAGGGNYKWQISKGVVMILPQEGIPLFLQTHIGHVHITDKDNLTAATDELLEAPEVRKAMRLVDGSVRSPEPGFQKLGASAEPRQKAGVDLDDISLLDALNVLALSQHEAVWSYTELSCKGRKSIHINFVSR